MIRIGSCSWTEKTLIKSGEFYPKVNATAEERLRYYAENFNTVEVDSSYYAIPSIRTAWLWAQRTPDDFVFHIKVYAALTGHGVAPSSLPKDLLSLLPDKDRGRTRIYIKEPSFLKLLAEKLIDSLKPLSKTGKLGVIVFQFPPWFVYSHSNLDYILACKEMISDLAIAVEFRHGSWLAPDRAQSTFEFLKNHGITYVTADEPQYGTLATVPFLPHVTTDIAYFRFHGRNKKNWFKKGVETSLRYDYLYSADELKEFKKRIISTDREAKTTFAMFNNCHGASAIKNALMLRELITIVRGS